MKNKTAQGLGNKNLLSVPKHDSLKYWRLKSNLVHNHMSIQFKLLYTVARVNTKRDWLICGHVTSDKCNV